MEQQINITEQIERAIDRQHRKKSEVAIAIGTTPQNLANFFTRKSIPYRWLVGIVRELDDYELKLIASNYLFELGIWYDSRSIRMPLNTLMDVDDEQNDREQLKLGAMRVFRKDPQDWSGDDAKLISGYLKELDEEMGAESIHKDSIEEAMNRYMEVHNAWI